MESLGPFPSLGLSSHSGGDRILRGAPSAAPWFYRGRGRALERVGPYSGRLSEAKFSPVLRKGD